MKKPYAVCDAYRTNSAGIWYFAADDGIFRNGDKL